MIKRLVLTFGFCLLLANTLPAMTVAAEHPGALPVLLGLEKVRSELQINSLQKAVLDSLRDEYKAAARKLLSPVPTTDAEKAAAADKLAKLNERYNERALSVLNKSQRKRLVEIEYQALGALSLYTPGVQKKLGLSADQKAKVEKLRKEGLLAVGKINRKFDEGKISYQERMKLLHDRKVAQKASLLSVLTPDQRAGFVALAGKAVSL